MSKRENKQQKDWFTLFTLGITTVGFAVTALICGLLAFHFNERYNIKQIDLEDTRASLATLREQVAINEEEDRVALGEARIIKQRMDAFYQKLLFEQEEPVQWTDLLKDLDRVYNVIYNQSMSNKERTILADHVYGLLDAYRKRIGRRTTETPDPTFVVEALIAQGYLAETDKQQTLLAIANHLKEKPSTKKETPPKKTNVAPSPSVAQTNAPPKKPEQPAPFKRHIDRKNGYTILFPRKWQVKSVPEANGVSATAPREGPRDFFTAYALLNVHNFNSPPDPDIFIEGIEKRLRLGSLNYELLNKETLSFGRYPATKLHSRFTKGQTPFEAYYLVLVKDKKGFVLTISAPEEQFSEDQEAFDTILKSVQIL